MTSLRAPRGLRQPALSDTRWLAKVKGEFESRINGGFRHPKHGAHVVSLGAGLPNTRTYDVLKAIERGTRFIAHQASKAFWPKTRPQWADALFSPLKTMQRYLQNTEQAISETFNYGSTQGLPIVRESFAELMKKDWGYDFKPEHIMPSSGGTTSLIDSLVRAFERVEGNFAVFVSAPTYTGTAARLAQAHNIMTFSVDSDDHGMKPESLRAKIQKARDLGLDLAFSIDVTLGHNPLGISYTKERIQEIYDVVVEAGMFHVEDDPYGSFIYDETIPDPPPTFAAIDNGKHHVVTLVTASKTDIPTFRSAFAHADVFYVLPEKDEEGNPIVVTLLDMMLAAGGMAYLVPNNLSTLMTVAQWYEEDLETIGSLKPEARRRTKLYKANRDALLESLERNFGAARGELVDWNTPTSGFFLRLKLKQRPVDPKTGLPMTSRQIVQWLMDHEFLITTPMSGFYAADARAANPEIGEDELRLCFSSGTPEDMDEAGRRLAEGIKVLLESR